VRSPLDELIAARPAFGGSTEAEELVSITHRSLRKGDIDWLEVGAGDGGNLRYLMSELSAGRTFRVIALEPAAPAGRIEGATWLKLRVEDYRPDRQFDWMNVRHSAYYMDDPVAEMWRLSSSLRPDASIALTHWSRDCVLHRLHVAICGDQVDGPTSGIEDIAQRLMSVGGLDVSDIERTETVLNVEHVAEDDEVASALYELARRGHTPLDPVANRAERVRDMLAAMPDPGRRLNGVMVIRRAR